MLGQRLERAVPVAGECGQELLCNLHRRRTQPVPHPTPLACSAVTNAGVGQQRQVLGDCLPRDRQPSGGRALSPGLSQSRTPALTTHMGAAWMATEGDHRPGMCDRGCSLRGKRLSVRIHLWTYRGEAESHPSGARHERNHAVPAGSSQRPHPCRRRSHDRLARARRRPDPVRRVPAGLQAARRSARAVLRPGAAGRR